MLVAVDVGNSHTKIALFRGPTLVSSWRLSTVAEATTDELASQLGWLLGQRGLPLPAVEELVVASVVPPLHRTWSEIAAGYLSCPAMVVGQGDAGPLRLEVDRPQEVGADRIADAVAAWQLHGAPAIVVDCGTATKVDAIGAGGRYLGGAIAPGIGIAAGALFRHAALLRRVELAGAEQAMGTTTEGQIQSGIAYGGAGQVDRLVEEIRAEMGGAERVIATGGLASVITPHSRTISTLDPLLTLHGLRLMAESRSKEGGA